MTEWKVVAVCALLASAAACDKKGAEGEGKPAPSASAPPPVATGKLLRLTLDPKGTASIDMPAPKDHIKARTDGVAGALEVDPGNLRASHGEVKIDLSTLTTSSYDDEAKNKTQTTQARCWLEVADCEEGKVGDDLKKKNRWAVYTIRSVELAGPEDLAKVAPAQDGPDQVRTVTATTKGDLVIHGLKAEGREAEVEIQFRYAPGAPADKPKAVALKTHKPLHVILAEHDVKPRDALGKIAKQSFHLLGTKVADTADISLDLRAAP
jgi:hypothetical protein